MASSAITARVPRRRRLHRLLNLRALQRVGWALAAGALCAGLAPADFHPGTRVVAGWDGFCLVFLILTWATIATADTEHLRRVATSQDPGRTWTFVAVLLAAGASLFAVALLLRGIKALPPREQAEQVAVSVVAVVGAWFLLHTLFTLRYAHVYFSKDPTASPPDELGGLQFPGDPPTRYWDFAYFAFTIGMTAQTSDTGVTSLRMRQLTLVHGLLSFAFNTAVVALGVNVVSSIL
jgi:uncharacterized membrane protein